MGSGTPRGPGAQRVPEHPALPRLTIASERLAPESERATAESAPLVVLERLLAVEVEVTMARRLVGWLGLSCIGMHPLSA